MEPQNRQELMHIEMEALLREAQDEQASILRLQDRAMKFLTEAALEEFTGLKNMNADQIREFGDIVSRAATNFAMRASSLAYRAEQDESSQ